MATRAHLRARGGRALLHVGERPRVFPEIVDSPAPPDMQAPLWKANLSILREIVELVAPHGRGHADHPPFRPRPVLNS